MKWVRRVSLVVCTVSALVFGVGTQANAAVPPQNVGWLYTEGGSGAVFFDADLAGYPSMEKITVCDNDSNDRGVVATLTGTDPRGGTMAVILRDPSNNGSCTADFGNFFADGFYVYVTVCEYWGSREDNCRSARGVA
ncbi:hypothetical protein [Streptomyces sp. VNUA24]|uniref:hypothetical protein n=1 Tax=Streptomyces sp. VNUA24 TaxID=3031131 RepID=UPI0023B81194|nr:hypothetical protein [Streptomyces sp. VNUA24]WEH14010.1 hypothetical protein PYR72_09930 [Streptomyces sp. VNUA24]